MSPESDQNPATANWLRIDLLIAVCALLISALASGASWWQARVMVAQTEVLRQQLAAQVWPYVAASEYIDGDTVKLSIDNDGPGPAIIRNASVDVDGIPKRDFVDVMHAILGPHLIARKPHGQHLGVAVNVSSPGSVLRAGTSTVAFALTSKRFAQPFMLAYRRLSVNVCYCAIIPGDCWQSDSASSHDPIPTGSCPERADDLLHASMNDVFEQKF